MTKPPKPKIQITVPKGKAIPPGTYTATMLNVTQTKRGYRTLVFRLQDGTILKHRERMPR